MPSLRASTPSLASLINMIVVGEEGRERKKWRTSFLWNPDSSEQVLPEEVTAKGTGWYFIRLYDVSDCLMDSLDFRYVPGLHSMSIKHISETDSEYLEEIEFVHDGSCTICPKEKLPPKSQVEALHGRTLASVCLGSTPQEPIRWVIESNETKVHLSSDLGRPCWTLVDEKTGPMQWQCRPIWLSRALFKPTGSAAMSIWLPRAYQKKNTPVGFTRYKSLAYRVKSDDRVLRIELRGFSDAQEVFSPDRAFLCVWLNQAQDSGEEVVEEKIIGVVPRLLTSFRCLVDQCGFPTGDYYDLCQHLASQHDVFQYLQPVENYDEFFDHYKNILGPIWPRKIYLCMHCNEYVSADDTSSNPNDAIWVHLRDEHPKASHSFRIVNSVDEIRQKVIDSLPKLYRCKYGDLYIEEKDIDDMWNHLLHVHKSDFIQTEETEEPEPIV